LKGLSMAKFISSPITFNVIMTQSIKFSK